MGHTIGPVLEAQEALKVLNREVTVPDLIDKAIHLCGLLFSMTGKKGGERLATNILKSGKAEGKMREIIASQGGDPTIKPSDIEIGSHRLDIKSENSGTVLWTDNQLLIQIARAAGAPKDRKAGIVIHKKIGQRVKKGESIITVFSERTSKLGSAERILNEFAPLRVGDRREMIIHKVLEILEPKRSFWRDKSVARIVSVIKSDGRRVPFDVYKVEATCRRAGASPSLAKRIAQYISEIAYDGISTKEIYELVLAALAGETEHPEIKHRYRLKESIMLLGPAGFNFETYVAEVLAANGYEISSIRPKVNGRCVEHEIDLSIAKDRSRIMVECKYHNSAGTFTGLKESMYTHARFLDITEGKAGLFEKEMLVSNTRVSQEALKYALCIGQEVLSWRYPPEEGLERLIEQKGLTLLQF